MTTFKIVYFNVSVTACLSVGVNESAVLSQFTLGLIFSPCSAFNSCLLFRCCGQTYFPRPANRFSFAHSHEVRSKEALVKMTYIPQHRSLDQAAILACSL